MKNSTTTARRSIGSSETLGAFAHGGEVIISHVLNGERIEIGVNPELLLRCAPQLFAAATKAATKGRRRTGKRAPR